MFKFAFLIALAASVTTDTSCTDENGTTTNRFYDTSFLDCKDCAEGQIPSDDGFSCQCDIGRAKSEATRDLPVFECVSCGGGSAPSGDDYLCQTCQGGQTRQDTGECACGDGEVVDEFAENGDYRIQKECVACEQLALYPGLGSNFWERCPSVGMIREGPDWECQCGPGYATAGPTCVTDADRLVIDGTWPVENAGLIVYDKNEGEDGDEIYRLSNSALLDYFYLKSATDCYIYQNTDGCQVLANLCVLQLYDEDSEACKVYRASVEAQAVLADLNQPDQGWKRNIPWLYYEEDTKDILENDSKVNFEVTFNPDEEKSKTGVLKFHFAKYSMNGTFLGFEDVSGQIILCPHSSSDNKKYREFGTNLEIDCTFNLERFYDYETVFYDMFLEDEDGNLLDVPILIKNYEDNDGSDEAKWQLVRRFFLVDNLSGLEGDDAYTDGDKPKVLRYANEVKIRIELQANDEQQIYIPILMLDYKSRETKYIEESNNEDDLSFESEYFMGLDNVITAALACFIVCNIATVIIWIMRCYIWTKNNPATHSRETYPLWFCGKALMFLIHTWAQVMFWYIFVFTGYWFIFYKMQYYVYILLPTQDNFDETYLPFFVLLGLVIFFQMIRVIDLIRQQANIEYFMIDWEIPSRVIKGATKVDNEGQDAGTGPIANQGSPPRADLNIQSEPNQLGVSAWRSLFVANELNELQTFRYINLEFTMVIVVFFMHGLDFNMLTTAQPNMDLDSENVQTIGNNIEATRSPENVILRFFLITFLFLIFGYLQIILRRVLAIWFPTPYHNFTDLLSVSNISLIILDQSLHGYYIHGKSPTGNADVTMDELRRTLEKESEGKARRRGIPEAESDLQSFEIYIPWQMRKTYDNLGANPVEAEIREQAITQKAGQASKIMLYSDALPKGINFEDLERVRAELNRRFKIYITTLISEASTNIKDKTPLQRFLFMPPTDLSVLKGSPFFYRDPGNSFENVFYSGKEFEILLFEMLIFVLLDLTIGNIFAAAIITYVISKFLQWVRGKTGERNIARKTLIDKRFLI